MAPNLTNTALINEYRHLFDTCTINEGKFLTVDNIADAIIANESRYDTVGRDLSIPWYFIGIIHNMEASLNFKTHLHNGDPLTNRTIHVPKGRPPEGNPPFTWEVSAADALRLQKLDQWEDWTIPGILFQFELFNGMGYRKKGIHSPYLWSFSNHYNKGKFTADGIFDSNAISRQCGAAVLLRRLCERQNIPIGELDRVSQIRTLGEQVNFNPRAKSATAEQLQQLLNSIGFALRADGFAGEKTSNAYKKISRKFLPGDPRRT